MSVAIVDPSLGDQTIPFSGSVESGVIMTFATSSDWGAGAGSCTPQISNDGVNFVDMLDFDGFPTTVNLAAPDLVEEFGSDRGFAKSVQILFKAGGVAAGTLTIGFDTKEFRENNL